ncbi:MAG: hypothetical protein PHE89_04180 [Alphaproteobacteria bacterium]|nr:hypothetical protein [Alphaproteobacteria bacterium]
MTVRTKLIPLGGRKPPYKVGTTVYEKAAPGTYTITLKAGTFELWLCGGGGGGGGCAGSHSWYGQVGGSAAAFKGLVTLPAGTYTVVIGAGGTAGAGSGRNATAGQNGTASSFKFSDTSKANITTGAGNGGFGTGNYSSANNGAGGVLTISALTIKSSTVRSNGVTASSTSLLGNGYGAGGAIQSGTSGKPGTSGYIKLIFRQ